jgi:hypothetical protein
MTKSQLQLLEAIEKGEKHTKANAKIAPLARASLVEVEWLPGWRVKSVQLSDWGKIVLNSEKKKINERKTENNSKRKK